MYSQAFVLLFNRFLLSKHSRPIFSASPAGFSCKNCPISVVLSVFLCVISFCLKIAFLLDTKGQILKQRELVNELVEDYTKRVLRPPCCSLTDFYCQNIQGQFSRRLLQFFL